MKLSDSKQWRRFQQNYREFPSLRLAVDISRMNHSDDFLRKIAPRMKKAFAEMNALEKGAIANVNENRMVGHYWLRTPSLAPNDTIRTAIEETLAAVKAFAKQIHSGAVQGPSGAFKNLLVIGIGGSALGPQFVSHALGSPSNDKMRLYFFDNTDPDGMDRVLTSLDGELERTLCVIISKSGGTKETRNGMLEAEAAFRKAGLDFDSNAVAITSAGSELDRYAYSRGWLHRFPMWDWVGGRTSETSAVGLLPAILQGIDIDELLRGAAACDAVTRSSNVEMNPAALLAAIWLFIGNERGDKAMVVLPYKDRLELFSRYLQQLIMESLGKAKDRDGKEVHTGLTVYGNKGSTDQHAYIQQLRDGLDNFFVTFIEVLRDREGSSIKVEPAVTSGDYLTGFYLGTRTALHAAGRQSITITISEVSPFSVGVLIALFERTVGFYASLVNINAYHQPGVEAGKKAATDVINLQHAILNFLGKRHGRAFTCERIAAGIKEAEHVEMVFKVCEHLAANGRGIQKKSAKNPFTATFRAR